MAEYPQKLKELVELFSILPDRTARIEMLIGCSERYGSVPEEIAARPYPEANRIKECESQAYVWGRNQPDGTLKFYVAVENPQGISAMATAVILDETLSGAPLEEVAEVPQEVIYDLFGRELSMGKSMGLTGILSRIKALARKRLEETA